MYLIQVGILGLDNISTTMYLKNFIPQSPPNQPQQNKPKKKTTMKKKKKKKKPKK